MANPDLEGRLCGNAILPIIIIMMMQLLCYIVKLFFLIPPILVRAFATGVYPVTWEQLMRPGESLK